MTPFPFDRRWTIHEAACMACLLEASAPKVGNVSPAHAFNDMAFAHFAASATAIGNRLQQTLLRDTADPTLVAPSVGRLALESVQAMVQTCSTNTYLGTILLFAPLAKSAHPLELDAAECIEPEQLQILTRETLAELTPDDAAAVYEAIQTASAGGLGSREQHDVHAGEAPSSLVEAMRQVASFDAVARQYTNGFEDVFQRLLPWLAAELAPGVEHPAISVADAICRLQLRWMAHEPDGLIWRKLGEDEARKVQSQASQAWDAVQRVPVPTPCAQVPEVADLDRSLRENGNRRNPGTTADLIAATLFVHLISNGS